MFWVFSNLVRQALAARINLSRCKPMNRVVVFSCSGVEMLSAITAIVVPANRSSMNFVARVIVLTLLQSILRTSNIH